MVEILSDRAKNTLAQPKNQMTEKTSRMRKYPGTEFSLWLEIEREGAAVKKLSYHGELKDHQIVLMESLATLLKGKSLAALESLTLRECEAFLRDRNSAPALSGLGKEDEVGFQKLCAWIRQFPSQNTAEAFSFDPSKGPFRSLKLIDKVKELKAFLNSPEVQAIYAGALVPELLDVEDLTAYVAASYQSENDKKAFRKLHELGVTTFQEENLNFIPEG